VKRADVTITPNVKCENKPLNFRCFSSPSASHRIDVARRALLDLPPGGTAWVVGASRAAADELAARVASEKGGLFGVTRVSFAELLMRLAILPLAADGCAPSGQLSEEALAARVAFEANDEDALDYFTPVADMPGFPRALSRTMEELRLAGITADALHDAPGLSDLSTLMERAAAHRTAAGAADYAQIVATATRELEVDRTLASDLVVLLDVTLPSGGEQAFVKALAAVMGRSPVTSTLLATVPDGDQVTYDALVAAGAAATRATDSGDVERSLHRLQTFLFSDEAPPKAEADDAVVVFSAPGEGREAVEIARRVVKEAARGVPFDEMAILVRAPQSYLSVLEHALDRAGVPAWFHRGTRRPDPAGRALLALLACAEEGLSARRFAEYVSLSQVPMEEASGWTAPTDAIGEAVIPPDERTEDRQPEEEARDAAHLGESAHAVAGTLRAPWRWEDLIVEAAVIGGIDRWQRRLAGLRQEYLRRLQEAESDEPESPRARALRRDAQQLDALSSFALPVLQQMSEWPAEQRWGNWLDALQSLVPTVLRDPARVGRVLNELAPLATVGPVGLREVRNVLAPRLSTLTHEPPRRRHGRVFIGTPHAARGRSFRVVFVPGLAERLFPQRIREDALLLDERRATLSAPLATLNTRARDERLHLKLAVGAAAERVYLSFPRIELNESRPRVPSFYVLDVIRAVEGRVPDAASLTTRAFRAGGSTLAWPAPADAEEAIDDVEHDLSTLGAVLAGGDTATAKGRARYLYELSPELRRSLTARWLRWHRRAWETADGLIRAADATAPMLASQRLGARPYSLSALQRFAVCPYQFLLSAIYRLAPLEAPTPLQRLDPLTRGDLFHRIQAHALRGFKDRGLLPLTAEHLPKARKLLEWSVTEIEREAHDRLAPAIDRVWRDEIAAMTRDLKLWLERLAEESVDWTPERFELAFGLDDTEGRDPGSISTPARVDDRFLLRGSIDLVERHNKTSFLRVTDHKTGRNRTKPGQTVVDGGRTLQPVIYGLALEALMPEQTVFSGRLFFCTATGDYTNYEIPLLGNARHAGIEVLEIIDRAIERGTLAARPAPKACAYCDFEAVCGRQEERRTGRKARELFADLDMLRGMP
jgi:ATP-dependent helicase/nuclease subunit B